MSNSTFLKNAFDFFLLFVPRNDHTKNQDSRAENVDRVILPKTAPLWWYQKLSPDGPFQRCPCPDPISASVVIFFPAVLLFFMFLRLVSSQKKKYCNQYISIRIQFLNSRKKKELCTQNLRGKVYCRKKTVLHYLSFHVSNPKPKKELYNHYYSGTPFFNRLISTSWEAFKGS